MSERRYHHLGLVATKPMDNEYYVEDMESFFHTLR